MRMSAIRKHLVKTIVAGILLAFVGTVMPTACLASGKSSKASAAKAPASSTPAKNNYKLPLNETMVYNIKALGLAVGSQTNTTKGIVQKDGRRTVDIFSAMKTNPWVAILSIDNSMETFMDTETLVPVRYEERANEKDWKAVITFKFFPDHFTFNNTKGLKLDRKEKGSVPYKERPQDQFSLMYYVRHLDLSVGKTFNIPCAVDNELKTAVVKVVETRKIKTAFGEKEVFYITSSIGEAKFLIGTDKMRIPYQFEVKLNIGSMKGILKEYKPETGVREN